MSHKLLYWHGMLSGLIILVLTGCYHSPLTTPFNTSQKVAGNTSAKKINKNKLIAALQKVDIQYVEYGDTMTLIVPTDRYFRFNSPRLNELCYSSLMLVVKLLEWCPTSSVYVAGFTDDVGSRYHKKTLTQARAETMLTYLWANNIHARRLNAEGYGDQYAVSDNKLIHGSAQNRRLEIQCFRGSVGMAAPAPYVGGMTK